MFVLALPSLPPPDKKGLLTMNSEQQQYMRHDERSYTSMPFHDEESAYRTEYDGYRPTQAQQQFWYAAGSSRQVFYRPSQDKAVLAAVFCYAFGWLSGLLFFLFAGSNRFIRYHALQSLLFFGGINALDIGLMFALSRHDSLYHSLVPYIGIPIVFGFLLLNFIAFVGWLVSLVQAARGTYFKLPVAGEIVSKMLGQPPDVK